MDLNKKDGGARKFILVTNNENNIAHDIAYERIYRVINGIGTKGQKDFD
jgi:adenine-specific DNA-methyltransferase